MQLQKFRKKTSKTVTVLTHVKEKIHFYNERNDVLQRELAELDSAMTDQRSVLAGAKGLREKLRAEVCPTAFCAFCL